MQTLNLSELIKTLKELTTFPVFKTDITKDETQSNESFFIVEQDGDLSRTEGNGGFRRDFLISFITKNDSVIDDIQLILAVEPHGLIFERTETDYGRMAGTQKEVKMMTFIFSQPLWVEYL